jgi:hypothetical protein
MRGLCPALFALLLATGCIAPPPPAERAADAVRELNLAARFGRTELAGGLTADSARKGFLQRRANWGRDIRVVDVELASFDMSAKDRVRVEVDYAWTRMDEGQLRTTRVAQEWRDTGRGFKLVSEQRSGGDLGLFGEPMPAADPVKRRDVQFATKVIQ